MEQVRLHRSLLCKLCPAVTHTVRLQPFTRTLFLAMPLLSFLQARINLVGDEGYGLDGHLFGPSRTRMCCHAGGDNEVQRTMLEIVNQLDGFDSRGNIKVNLPFPGPPIILMQQSCALYHVLTTRDTNIHIELLLTRRNTSLPCRPQNCDINVQVLMATNRPDTLDPALLRPGRLDRKVEFGLPDLESRTQIFQIHTRTMNCERDIRFELLSRHETLVCNGFALSAWHGRLLSMQASSSCATCCDTVAKVQQGKPCKLIPYPCQDCFVGSRVIELETDHLSDMQAMPKLNRRRHQKCMHRGWHVRHPSAPENSHREGLPGCRQ